MSSYCALVLILLVINICLTAYAVGAVYMLKRRFFTKKGWIKYKDVAQKEKKEKIIDQMEKREII